MKGLLSAPNPDDPLDNNVADHWKRNEADAVVKGETQLLIPTLLASVKLELLFFSERLDPSLCQLSERQGSKCEERREDLIDFPLFE